MIYLESIFILFIIGAIFGWILELFYRRFITMKKWINPGFLKGPYLPIYGIGMIVAFYICELQYAKNYYLDVFIKLMVFLILSTFLELIAGLILSKVFHIKLWDYQNKKGNINGFICITYSLLWAFMGLIYYLFFHQMIVGLLILIYRFKLLFFLVGVICGIILIDLKSKCFKNQKNNH